LKFSSQDLGQVERNSRNVIPDDWFCCAISDPTRTWATHFVILYRKYPKHICLMMGARSRTAKYELKAYLKAREH